MNTSSLRRLVALSFLALSACGGGGGGGGGPTSPTQYSIGGTVTGLNSGATLVLQVNGGLTLRRNPSPSEINAALKAGRTAAAG